MNRFSSAHGGLSPLNSVPCLASHSRRKVDNKKVDVLKVDVLKVDVLVNRILSSMKSYSMTDEALEKGMTSH